MARRRKVQRFAQKALLVITIWLAVFSAAQMVIFAVTGVIILSMFLLRKLSEAIARKKEK